MHTHKYIYICNERGDANAIMKCASKFSKTTEILEHRKLCAMKRLHGDIELPVT
jgi:hypothetical protein